MRFKVTLGRELKHSDFVSGVGWASSDEVISAADDHKLLKWDLKTGDTSSLAELPAALYPTDLQFYPRSAGSAGKGGDIFALSSSDGKIYLIAKSGRVEKVVDAHRGAVLGVRWSNDGSSLLSVGEDGQVKIWSRNGMLRSTLFQAGSPVYSCAWSPDNTSVFYCVSSNAHVRAIQGAAKGHQQWKAHDGVALAADWSCNSGLIVTGGEDCRYKVWDGFGRQLFVSSAHDFPVTCVAWSLDGDVFAVGSYNTLRLCDKAGWSHSLDKSPTGSILRLAWSPDSTQVACGCANGHVLYANVVENRCEWQNYEAVQTRSKTIDMRNVLNGSKEHLELKSRVVKMALAWNYLVVTTTNNCYVYSSKNWNTPHTFDLKDGAVNLILMAPKHFLLASSSGIHIYTYEGRLQTAVRLPSVAADGLSRYTCALSNDTLSMRDRADHKTIHIVDPTTGKSIDNGKVVHSHDVLSISLDQCGSITDRRMVLVDSNQDLFIVSVKSRSKKPIKIGMLVQQAMFNDSTPMLCALQDSKLLIWLFPSAAYVDKELMADTVVSYESNDFGKSPQLLSFIVNHVAIRRADGSVVGQATAPFASAMHEALLKNKWDNALRLARRVNDTQLWAALAVMATHSRQFSAAEIAYAAINQAEKVHYLRRIRNVAQKEVRDAELWLLAGAVDEAEQSFLQAGQVLRAIMANVQLHRWDRALELAQKQKNHIDTVLAYRQRYLESVEAKESKQKFIDLAKEIEVDWETVQERVEHDMKK